MENFTDLLDDREAFASAIKERLNKKAFSELEELKREVANDFLTSDEDED